MAGFADWSPPAFSPTSIPTLPSLSLSDDEKALIGFLQSKQTHDSANMVLTNSYYMGAQSIQNLEIAIPRDLALKLRTLVGWARVAVDPMVERLHVEGFRLPGETDVNDRLGEIWTRNGMDAEFPVCVTDALSMGRGWLLGGTDADGRARITVESPLNVAVQWAADGRTPKAALQTYTEGLDQQRAAVYLPNRTVFIGQNERKEWELLDVDVHNFGYVPLERMANNPRSDNRDGYSEITPELMSTIDGACRRLMGLEASSELYSIPRMLILGANADDFQNPNGQARKAWDAYISKINVLERDEDGEVPTVTQLTAYDPSVFTRVIEMYASQAAGILAAVPQDLGLYTEGNPVSAEAWNATETRRNRRAMSKQRTYGVTLSKVMQLALRLENNGALPAGFDQIAVDWMSPEMVSFTAAADAISKLANPTVGVLPAQSDVTLKRAGFSAVERAQIERDRGPQRADQIVAALQSAKPAPEVNGGDTAPVAG